MGKDGVPLLEEAGWGTRGDIGVLTLGSRSYVEFGVWKEEGKRIPEPPRTEMVKL